MGRPSAVNENAQGGLQSFSIGQNGVLSNAIDTISSGGDSPAFTTPLSTGQVAVFNVGRLLQMRLNVAESRY